jgi:hypothetical protein
VRLAPTIIGVASLVASLLSVGFASASGPGIDGGTVLDGGTTPRDGGTTGTADGGKLLAPSGAPCKQHADCRSNACISGICRARCDATTKCATTQTCTKMGVCLPNDAGVPTESVPPAPPAKDTSTDDAEEDEDGIVKDEEYWKRMPTKLEPPPDNRAGCSLSSSAIGPFTGTGVLFAATCALLRRRRRP